MKEKIKAYFEGPGKEAMEHLGSGANILITIGETPYTLEITDERKVKVENGGKKGNDVEIRGEKKVMDDLLSSSSRHEFTDKMKSYIRDKTAPKVKILMQRTLENTKKFYRIYHFFFYKIDLLK